MKFVVALILGALGLGAAAISDGSPVVTWASVLLWVAALIAYFVPQRRFYSLGIQIQRLIRSPLHFLRGAITGENIKFLMHKAANGVRWALKRTAFLFLLVAFVMVGVAALGTLASNQSLIDNAAQLALILVVLGAVAGLIKPSTLTINRHRSGL